MTRHSILASPDTLVLSTRSEVSAMQGLLGLVRKHVVATTTLQARITSPDSLHKRYIYNQRYRDFVVT